MNRKEKRGIITSLITGFIGLAYEGISNFCTIKGIKLYIKHLQQWNQNQIYIAINSYIEKTLWSCMESTMLEL